MMHISVFKQALAGKAIAFAPIVWDDLPRLTHQGNEDWWLNPEIAQRLIVDAASISGSDAMFIRYDDKAITRVAESNNDGNKALESLVESSEIYAGFELCTRLTGSHATFAVIATLPSLSFLKTKFNVLEQEIAEDVLVDLGRGFLEAGANALAIMGNIENDIIESVRHIAEVGNFFGRPVLGICIGGNKFYGWVEGAPEIEVNSVTVEGEWPSIDYGLVTTNGDMSGIWDASLLREVGRRRP